MGANGILCSPDFEHFKRSLWPEFRRWCPIECVVEKERYRFSADWEPSRPFEIHFMPEATKNLSTLYCGGIDDPGAWEGPNVNFAHLDEARRKKDAGALKVLDGRVRIPGPHGESPQLYLTTTPRKNWLYEYFGPAGKDDIRVAFKADSLVVTLLTEDNERAGNLEAGYTQKRGQSLTESEKRVLLNAEWEDIDEAESFLPSMALWDAIQEKLPALGNREPLVIAMDGATGRTDSKSDCFGIVGVTRHPTRRDDVAARLAAKWQAQAGQHIDFEGTDERPGPLKFLRSLCKAYNVVQICYDPSELHYAAQVLNKESIAWLKEFPQGAQRGESDKQLLDLIMQRRLAHDGNVDLREHVSNANQKKDAQDKKLRIVKREESMKIDLCVCLSMATFESLRLNL